ncbi:MAG TPA: hypothetical protein PKA41_17040 [Verrucomicrobiota bacterium]|nr:hypothetical protein [Verrucomicrobiota bacterium]
MKSLKSLTNMKSGTFKLILDGALALSLVLSAVFCVQYIFLSREFRALNIKAATANAHRQTIQALVIDCVEYSKRNAAIDPLLKSIGAKQ